MGMVIRRTREGNRGKTGRGAFLEKTKGFQEM